MKKTRVKNKIIFFSLRLSIETKKNKSRKSNQTFDLLLFVVVAWLFCPIQCSSGEFTIVFIWCSIWFQLVFFVFRQTEVKPVARKIKKCALYSAMTLSRHSIISFIVIHSGSFDYDSVWPLKIAEIKAKSREKKSMGFSVRVVSCFFLSSKRKWDFNKTKQK